MRRRAIALALAPLLLAAACGGGSGGKEADASQCPVEALDTATKPVDITFWHSMTASNEETLKKLTDEYNAAQQKVHVTLVFQGGYDDSSDKYLTALRGGKLPNLIMLEETRIQPMIDSKSVVPVQACVDADDYSLTDFLPAVIAEDRVDGTLWPMPFNVSGPVLFYDANDFTKAGLDPSKPPSTYAEVIAAAKAIKESGAAKSGIALTERPGNIEQLFAKAGKPIVNQDNGRSGRADDALLATAPGVDALTFMQQLVQQGLAINVGSNVNEADNLLALGAGDAGMTIGTSAAIGTIYAVKDAGQYKDVEVGVAPLPGPSSSNGGVLVSGAALWMVDKGKTDLEKAATWDFLKFLDEPDSQATWALGTGYMPIRKAAAKDPEVAALWARRPAYRVAYDQLLASNSGEGPVIGAYKEFRLALVGAIERVLLKNQDPKAALAQADKEAEEAMKSYNERVGD